MAQFVTHYLQTEFKFFNEEKVLGKNLLFWITVPNYITTDVSTYHMYEHERSAFSTLHIQLRNDTYFLLFYFLTKK